jgi:hypothetical protein
MGCNISTQTCDLYICAQCQLKSASPLWQCVKSPARKEPGHGVCTLRVANTANLSPLQLKVKCTLVLSPACPAVTYRVYLVIYELIRVKAGAAYTGILHLRLPTHSVERYVHQFFFSRSKKCYVGPGLPLTGLPCMHVQIYQPQIFWLTFVMVNLWQE